MLGHMFSYFVKKEHPEARLESRLAELGQVWHCWERHEADGTRTESVLGIRMAMGWRTRCCDAVMNSVDATSRGRKK